MVIMVIVIVRITASSGLGCRESADQSDMSRSAGRLICQLQIADDAELVPEGIGHNCPFKFRGVWRVSTFRSNQAPAKRDDLVDRVIDILDSDVNMRPVL